MKIDQKYEWQTPLDVNPAIAVHRRLGREVSIHVIDSSSLSTKHRKAIRETVSKLTKLDHPAIPCLVDFVEQDGKCYVVLLSLIHI